MASIERRIERLEAHMPPSEDAGGEERRALMRSILEEFGRLRACRARGYRGGTPPIPIQPTDPVGQEIGYPYTRREVLAFAIRRFLERREMEQNPEDRIAALTEGLDWDEIEATGPPEPAPPWRSGGNSR